MSERELNILQAAERVFLRYGVKRASMSDVAQEAGISRQTLYKAFRSKDDILRFHIRVYSDQAIKDIKAALKSTTDLGDQIDLILQRMIVPGFELVRSSPNAQDIIEGINDTTKEELALSAERFQAVLVTVLEPFKDALNATDTTPAEMAGFIQMSARAAKDTASDKKNLVRQLHLIRALCVKAANE